MQLAAVGWLLHAIIPHPAVEHLPAASASASASAAAAASAASTTDGGAVGRWDSVRIPINRLIPGRCTDALQFKAEEQQKCCCASEAWAAQAHQQLTIRMNEEQQYLDEPRGIEVSFEYCS